MKFSTIICCGLIAVGYASLTIAGPAERGAGFRPMAQDQRPLPGRERRAQTYSRQGERRARGDAEPVRMSPEERRQLRRDIQDAGKDIYRPKRQGRRDVRRPERR